MLARSGDAVQDGEAEFVAAPEVGIGAVEKQRETGETPGAVGPPDSQWLLENVEPSRIFAWPVDVRERHTDDLGVAAAGCAPQELLCKRLAIIRLVAVLGISGEHPARELWLAVESRGAGGRNSAVAFE